MGTVNVGDKIGSQITLRIRLEGLSDHDRAKIRTANTDIDDGLDGLSGVTGPGAGANLLRELLHVGKHTVDLRSNVNIVNLQHLVGLIAKRDVVDGTVLGKVDLLAGKERVTKFLDLGLLCEVNETRQNFFIHNVLGEVEEDLRAIVVGEGMGELGEAGRVFGEEFLYGKALAGGVVDSL